LQQRQRQELDLFQVPRTASAAQGREADLGDDVEQFVSEVFDAGADGHGQGPDAGLESSLRVGAEARPTRPEPRACLRKIDIPASFGEAKRLRKRRGSAATRRVVQVVTAGARENRTGGSD